MPPQELQPAPRIVWNKVTWYSQLIAVVLFVGIFAFGFYLGSEYQTIQPPSMSASESGNQSNAQTPTVTGTTVNVQAPVYYVFQSSPDEVYAIGTFSPMQGISMIRCWKQKMLCVLGENGSADLFDVKEWTRDGITAADDAYISAFTEKDAIFYTLRIDLVQSKVFLDQDASFNTATSTSVLEGQP